MIAMLLMLWDFVAIHAAYFLSLWFRFDCQFGSIPDRYLTAYSGFITIYAVVSIAIYWLLRLYRSIWRFFGVEEVSRIIVASVVTTAIHILGINAMFGRMPLSYQVLGALFQLIAITGVRFAYRFYSVLMARLKRPDTKSKRVMIIGAGSAGQMLLHDLTLSKETDDKVVCFIDDDPIKCGRYIDGVPVVGGREEILKASQEYQVDKILLAIPSASAEAKRSFCSAVKSGSLSAAQKWVNAPSISPSGQPRQ